MRMLDLRQARMVAGGETVTVNYESDIGGFEADCMARALADAHAQIENEEEEWVMDGTWTWMWGPSEGTSGEGSGSSGDLESTWSAYHWASGGGSGIIGVGTGTWHNIGGSGSQDEQALAASLYTQYYNAGIASLSDPIVVNKTLAELGISTPTAPHDLTARSVTSLGSHFGGDAEHPDATTYTGPNSFDELLGLLMLSSSFQTLIADMNTRLAANNGPGGTGVTSIRFAYDADEDQVGTDSLGMALEETGGTSVGIYISPDAWIDNGDHDVSAAVILAHEFQHAYRMVFGLDVGPLYTEELATDFEELVAAELRALGYNEWGRVNYNDGTLHGTGASSGFGAGYSVSHGDLLEAADAVYAATDHGFRPVTVNIDTGSVHHDPNG